MPSKKKPTALVLMGSLWPGNDSSGPNISLASMMAALSDEFRFLRVACDRSGPSAAPLAPSGRWIEAAGGAALYLPPGAAGRLRLAALLRETPHDLLLLNGFHDREFTIPALALRRLGLVPSRATILSPRGEFSTSALGIKPLRKTVYQAFARRAGLLADVWLHATSAAEAEDIERGFPFAKGRLVAANIRPLPVPVAHVPAQDGALRLVFLGRISRMKNLDLALKALAHVRARILFDIYGPVEDAAYWRECQWLAEALPENIVVAAHGEIANEATPLMFARHDLLFLPSRSENFGHAIFEALGCGVPALIGDATPWRGLERDAAGFDLPLDAAVAFARAIDAIAAMDAASRARLRAGARARAERWSRESDAVDATRRMFRHALAEGPPCAA